MPQVLSSPVSQVITNGGTDLFSYPNTQSPSILSQQTPASQPLPAGTSTATNLLSPPLQTLAQMSNFPDTIYDLAPTSLLVHFMQVMLGNAGAGQLRKRQMIARLQQAVTSTHFYDLDSFYGALFGAQRGPSGSLPTNPNTNLPVNPYSDLASPDGWDEVQAIDAQFRERIIALAKAITLGGTVPGMQALGEAITGVPCQVYETWRLLDNALGPAPGANTWAELMTDYPAWDDITAGTTWQNMEGVVTFSGLMGNGAPNEIVIQPKKTYSSTVADQAAQGSDMFGILSVTEVLKPAASLVSASVNGPGVVIPATIAAAWADSEYWEVVQTVTPFSTSDPAYSSIVNSYQGENAGELPPGTYVQPSPPLSRTTGSQYSYAGDVTTVTAQAVTGAPAAPVVTDGQDFETVCFRNGKTLAYLPAQALMPPAKAASARTTSPVAVMCAPYSGPRVPVMRAS